MLLKKRLIIAAAVLAALVVLYTGASYWMGVKAEETLQEQHKMLTGIPLFKVKSHTYKRGWFSSTETTELTVNPELMARLDSLLPGQTGSLSNKSIRFTQHISHGPLPGLADFDLRPSRAIVNTQFEFREQTKEKLENLFGEQPPITLVNCLGFGGGGVLHISIPAFEHEDTLSGAKMLWKGLTFNVDYTKSFKEHDDELSMPGFQLIADKERSITFSDIHYTSSIHSGQNGMSLGSRDVKIGSFAVNWKSDIPYHIRLNELIFLATKIPIGEFVNPSGELQFNGVSIKNWKAQLVISEQDAFVNMRLHSSFDHLTLNNQQYDVLAFDAAGTHLHGPTLKKLFDGLYASFMNSKQAPQQRANQLDQFLADAAPLLLNNPKISVDRFSLKTPNGMATFNGQFSLIGLTEQELKQKTFFKKIEAKANLSLPHAMLESMAIAQMRMLFAVDASAEEQPDQAAIDDLAKTLLNDGLKSLVQDGYVKDDGKQVQTSLALKNGEVTAYNKKLQMSWDDDDDSSELTGARGNHRTALIDTMH